MRRTEGVMRDVRRSVEVEGARGLRDGLVLRLLERVLKALRQRVAAPCVREAGRVRCEAVVEHTVEVHIDEWTYDFGEDRFVEYLTFEQGQLVRVNEGSYGHKSR